MNLDDKQLGELLLAGNYITEEDLSKAKKVIVKSKETLTSYILSQGFLTKDLIGQAIAEFYNVAYTDLNSLKPTKERVLEISEDIAKEFHCVLVEKKQKPKAVKIATDNPNKEGLKEVLEGVFPGSQITITYSLGEDIVSVFGYYQKPLATRFSKILEQQTRVAPEMLEEIFNDALAFKASDIHFEPQPEEVVVRFRVDGILREAGRLPRAYYENVLNRVKVKSRLRIDEHNTAQDGAMRYEHKDTKIDLRVSVVPTVAGEKIVFRVLGAYVEGFGLTNLGLMPEQKQMLEDAARKPFGMILVTGPTGSGKTTTLYAVLKLLHNPEVNITTIEDPVEYKIRGVNQIQVNKDTDLTFARGLRSIVRQDPDIILVGEIRDDETAEIGVNAALTGHLLLSTFHANDAATAIPRLMDMSIEPFLLASTLEVVIAQRLVRKICENCRYSYSLTTKQFNDEYNKTHSGLKKHFKGKAVSLYKGKGCEVCNGSGFTGRTAIFEFIKVTPELQELILSNPSSGEIWELARSQGSESLFDDGVKKVKNGITTLEELIRIAPPPRSE